MLVAQVWELPVLIWLTRLNGTELISILINAVLVSPLDDVANIEYVCLFDGA